MTDNTNFLLNLLNIKDLSSKKSSSILAISLYLISFKTGV